MRTRKNPNFDYSDALNGKPTSTWLYANWEPLYVPQYRWQPRLLISLPSDALSTTRDEPMLWSSTKMQSFSSTQSLDKPTLMLQFKIILTELKISFNLTWNMKTHDSLLHPL